MFFAPSFLLLLGSAAAHLMSYDGFARCAIGRPTDEQVVNAKLLDEQNYKSPTKHICVDTYMHIIYANKTKPISKLQVAAQFKALNVAFNPYDISFELLNVTFTKNDKWASGDDEGTMKDSLRQGDYASLNLYFVDTAKLDNVNALGYCGFPINYPSDDTFTKDGCVIAAESVPGGTSEPYNLGGTAIHEVGHWFGLFHTFQGGCEGDGDFVDDTPAQKEATSGCPSRMDTCPDLPGDDPIHNYMDYSYE